MVCLSELFVSTACKCACCFRHRIAPSSIWSLQPSFSHFSSQTPLGASLFCDPIRTQWFHTNYQVLRAITNEPAPPSLVAVYQRPKAHWPQEEASSRPRRVLVPWYNIILFFKLLYILYYFKILDGVADPGNM